MVREIITLQLGHCANFVGTHYWNTQAKHLESTSDEVDYDVLYRTGENYKGELTYTPRLVVCDLKGSLGTLRQAGELYEPSEGERKAHAWNGKMEVFESEPIQKNQYLKALDDPNSIYRPTYASDLSRNVKVWSDFNSLYYHPTTIYELTTHTHGDENNRFLLHSRGREVYQELAMDETLMDYRIRAFMEESDNPQGFQVFMDTFDGFSGIAAATIESLSEEYSKKDRVVFGISQPKNAQLPREQQLVQNINQALTLKCMSEYSNLYIPMRTANSADYESGRWRSNLKRHENIYEWSGYLAAAIETATLPFCLKTESHIDMHDLAGLLNPHSSTSVAALSFGFPLAPPVFRDIPISSIFNTVGKSHKFEGAWDLTLGTPYDLMDPTTPRSFSVFRGLASVLQSQRPSSEGNPPYTSTQITEELTNFIKSNGPMFAKSTILQTPFLVNPSFPQMFGPRITSTGLAVNVSSKEAEEQMNQEKNASPVTVLQCATYARFHSGPCLRRLFENAATSLHISPLNNWVYSDFATGQFGLDRSDFAAIREALQDLSDSYGEGDMGNDGINRGEYDSEDDS
ncbi:hypothetical protein BASA61_008436 [Batrachochytrium salamandrivorans]|nr:hypothetical protein BASA61_008436 [Batrachochytrium salamandrivorans]